MPEPCVQDANIDKLQRGQEDLKANHQALHAKQHDTDHKVDTVLSNQRELSTQLSGYFERLEKILLAEVEHRKNAEQMQRDLDHLGDKIRDRDKVIDDLRVFKNACEALEIKEKVKLLAEEQQQRKGWSKYRSEFIALAAAGIAVAQFVLARL